MYERRGSKSHAVLIDLAPRKVHRLGNALYAEGLSRDGTEVLGAADNNVVVRKPNGVLKVLAFNATLPSWTK